MAENTEKKPNLEQFCDAHIVTAENPAGTDCGAHLAEARVFKCPYTIRDIKLSDFYNTKKVDLVIERCPDFKLNKEMAKSLVKDFEKDQKSITYLLKEVYETNKDHFKEYIKRITNES